MCFSPFLSSSSSFPEVKRQRSVPEDPKRAMEEQLPATEAELRPPEEEVLHAYKKNILQILLIMPCHVWTEALFREME